MHFFRPLALCLLPLWLAACSTATSVSSRDVAVDESYTGGSVGKILVLAVMPDRHHDSRVILERSFSLAMQDAGISAVSGYTVFESLDDLTGEADDFAPELARRDVDAVLFLDPIRLDADFDPTEYDNTRTVYRALDMQIAESVMLWSRVAHETSASKVILNAGLWRPGGGNDLWNATYDIKAPMNYNPDAARQHSRVFAERVIADLRAAGLVD